MCSARILLAAVSQLPDDVSLQKIAEKIEFLAAIDQLDRGERIPPGKVKRQLATWLAS